MWLLNVIINNKHVIEVCRLNNFDVFGLCIIYTTNGERFEQLNTFQNADVDIFLCAGIEVALFVKSIHLISLLYMPITLMHEKSFVWSSIVI